MLRLFAGVEVKSGSPLRVDAEEEMIVHISLVRPLAIIDFFFYFSDGCL